MICGFTGTHLGMKPRQLRAVRLLIYPLTELHLGDCVGADKEAYDEAEAVGVRTVGHPPTENRLRAFCDYDEERSPKGYLERDRDIVAAARDGLIAAPSGWVEQLRSGTWATVRYARKAGRKIWIVRPDGSVEVEQEGIR